MKHNTPLKKWIPSVLVGMALAASTTVGLAQATDWMQTFDTSTSTGPWVVWWGGGGTTVTISWDGSQDYTTNVPGSGAMKYVFPCVGTSGEQFMTFAGFHYGWQWDNSTILDGTLYTNIIFDIKMDPGTAPAVNGTDLGQLDIGFVPPSWDSSKCPHIGYYTIPLTATNWTHVVLPIDPTTAGINNSAAIYIKMWSDGHLTNTWTAYLDNLEVQAIPTNAPPPPAPTLSLQSTTPGLQVISTTVGGANARYSIHTANPYYSWVNSPGPTTYSITIKDYPVNPYNYFQTHMFLIPYGSLPYGAGDSACDWNSTNAIFVSIQNNPNGSGFARWMWKTNVTDHSTWGANQVWNRTNPPIPTLSSKTILGTWSVTFNNNTNVTFTAPDNTTTNFILPPEAIPWFTDANGMYAYFGIQPNGAGNVGQSAVMGEIKITGGVDGAGSSWGDIDDTFAYAPLDTTTWGLAASDANGVQVVDSTTPYWLIWTLPATGYTLQWSPDYPPGNWSDPGLSPIQIGPLMRTLIPFWLSQTNTAFFSLTNTDLGSNSQNIVTYQQFDLAQGTTNIVVPTIKAASFAVGQLFHVAPNGASVSDSQGTNVYTALSGWQAPNQYLIPGNTYEFYNPDATVWTIAFTGDVLGAAPAVLVPPLNQTVELGNNAAFTVYAAGNPTLQYQWQHGGVNLSGATGTSLSLTNVQLADAGSYTVGVTNGSGGVVSSAGVLTVLNPAATFNNVMVETNTFHCTVNGLANHIYTVEEAPSVAGGAWNPVYTNDGTQMPFQFSIPAVAGQNRYYRAVYKHQIITP